MLAGDKYAEDAARIAGTCWSNKNRSYRRNDEL